jgi:hydrogenase-4 component B
MQYSSSSFAQILVELFSWVLRPQVHMPKICSIFPQREKYHSHVPDIILDGFLIPTARLGESVFRKLRGLQSGSEHAYLLYILLTILVLFLWR